MNIFKKKEKSFNEERVTWEMFHANEVKTNRVAAVAVLSVTSAEMIYALGSLHDLLHRGFLWCPLILIGFSIFSIVLCVLSVRSRFDKWWVKYAMLLSLIMTCGVLHLFFPTTVVFLVFGPIMVSTIYYDRHLTIAVSVLTVIIHALNVFLNWRMAHISESVQAFHLYANSMGWFNTKYVVIYMCGVKTISIIIAAFVGVAVASAGRKLVIEQAGITRSKSFMEAELDAAADIQLKTMPAASFRDPSERISVDAYIKPARETGGDFYDYFMIDENVMAVAVADVSDKGLGAAMFSMQALSAVRFALTAGGGTDLAGAANLVNRQLFRNNREEMFITMWVACIDCRTGMGKYVNAGHLNPLVKQADGSIRKIENNPQLFMGLFDDVEYEAGVLEMKPGDSLILFTDGVTDARNEKDITFGEGGLIKVMEAESSALEESDLEIRGNTLTEQIAGMVATHIGDASQFDDITVMTVEYSDGGDENVTSRDRRLVLQKPAARESIPEIIDEVNDLLQSAGCPDAARRDIDLVIDDVCTNITDYAYDETETSASENTMEAVCEAGANFARLQFRDRGKQFNPLEAKEPSFDDEPQFGGLGIYLIRNVTDRMDYSYEDGWNVLTVTKIWNM